MNMTAAPVDRAAAATLRLVVLVNILFLISFLAAIASATGKAQAAGAPACTGANLLDELQRDDPAAVAKIHAEAAKTQNGKGLLWKIEKAEQEPSFLFGTMHMTDPRVTRLTPQARAAFEGSATVVIETTDILDQAAMMVSLVQRPELMMFTDTTTLTSLMTREDAAAVEAGLEERGISPASVAKMKPWMLSAMVALPACELARKNAGALVLDAKLAADAQAAGKKLAGLETAMSQLEAMASLPMEFHLKGLADTIRLGGRMDDVIETMIVLYTAGETAMFWPLFNAVLPSGGGVDSGFAAFEETMISARNARMAESAARFLSEGDAFIAVGALHLPGPQGLIEIFRAAGYKVSPAG